MIASIYKNALRTLTEKPLTLWGLSLMSMLLSILTLIFGVLPIIIIPIILTINAGAAIVYLNGCRGAQVTSEQLFSGFKDFPRVAGGMCWRALWIFIWFLVPIAGIVLAVIKSFAYAFVPYTLIESPGISATEALKRSMEKTNGYKLKMFAAWILPIAAAALVFAALSLLGMIPFAGVVFNVIKIFFAVACAAIMPLFLGLVSASFYEAAENGRIF